MALTRDQFFAYDDRKLSKVVLDGFPDALYVRMPSLADTKKIYEVVRTDPDHVQAYVVSLCACDESGNLLFTSEDAAAIESKSPKTVFAIYKAADDLLATATPEVSDLKKNSVPTTD